MTLTLYRSCTAAYDINKGMIYIYYKMSFGVNMPTLRCYPKSEAIEYVKGCICSFYISHFGSFLIHDLSPGL